MGFCWPVSGFPILLSGQHLSKQSYDEGFFEHVEQEVRVPDSSDEHENGLFVDPLIMEELNAAIANTSNTKSFDTDGIHLSMIKNMGYKARELLLQIFNNCWETASWPWKKSRVIFIRKPNKERYDDCSSYRSLSISSHFGKLLERILAGRINKYLDLHNIIGQEQKGFRTKRNTVRSLYRLHLSLERAKASKLPTALLNIDLEKAFDSVWISGLLYKLRNYNIDGRIFRILEAFLRNRHVFIE